MKRILESMAFLSVVASLLATQPASAQVTVTDLGTLIGGTRSDAYGINDNGQVVGWSNNATGDRHAVLRTIISDVSDPADAIQDLIHDVDALNLQHGIDNSLDAKLDAARNALQYVNMNNNAATINAMEAFINAVTAQQGKAITMIEAKVLIAAAQGIIDELRGA
jgi:hypothetical protein